MRWLCFVVVLAGCSESLGGPCSDDGDCKSGLFCAKGGALRDTCTAACAQQESYCAVRWGKDATCNAGFCALTSSGAAADPCEGRCNPNTMKCRTEPGPPTCVVK